VDKDRSCVISDTELQQALSNGTSLPSPQHLLLSFQHLARDGEKLAEESWWSELEIDTDVLFLPQKTDGKVVW
jgi:hypothetical protein